MFWLLGPTLLALVAALLTGGSPRALVRHGLRAWPAVVVAFAIELVLFNPPFNGEAWAMSVGPWIWLASQGIFLTALVLNGWSADSRIVWPWRLAAVGVGLNTVVIALNGGHMPQSPEAALAVWGASHIDPNRLQNVAAMSVNTRLPWFGDVIAEPAWLPRPNVISIGDVLLSMGVASWIFVGTRSQPGFVRVNMGSRNGTRIDGAARPHEDPIR